MAEGNGWGKIEEAEGEKFRILTGSEAVSVPLAALKHQGLIRIKIGTTAAALAESTKITLLAGKASHIDGVCKTRWICWLMPQGMDTATLTIEAEKPVRVYGIEVYDGSEK